MTSEKELDDAFQRGREMGRKEDTYRFLLKGVPAFGLWTRRVEFEATPSLFESLVAYERGVLEQLRHIQRERSNGEMMLIYSVIWKRLRSSHAVRQENFATLNGHTGGSCVSSVHG